MAKKDKRKTPTSNTIRLEQKAGYNQHASHFELHSNPKGAKYKIFNAHAHQ